MVGLPAQDIAGFMFMTMGVLYAVVLAFVVFAVWERPASCLLSQQMLHTQGSPEGVGTKSRIFVGIVPML
jgi:hypothetical protein